MTKETQKTRIFIDSINNTLKQSNGSFILIMSSFLIPFSLLMGCICFDLSNYFNHRRELQKNTDAILLASSKSLPDIIKTKKDIENSFLNQKIKYRIKKITPTSIDIDTSKEFKSVFFNYLNIESLSTSTVTSKVFLPNVNFKIIIDFNNESIFDPINTDICQNNSLKNIKKIIINLILNLSKFKNIKIDVYINLDSNYFISNSLSLQTQNYINISSSFSSDKGNYNQIDNKILGSCNVNNPNFDKLSIGINNSLLNTQKNLLIYKVWDLIPVQTSNSNFIDLLSNTESIFEESGFRLEGNSELNKNSFTRNILFIISNNQTPSPSIYEINNEISNLNSNQIENSIKEVRYIQLFEASDNQIQPFNKSRSSFKSTKVPNFPYNDKYTLFLDKLSISDTVDSQYFQELISDITKVGISK